MSSSIILRWAAHCRAAAIPPLICIPWTPVGRPAPRTGPTDPVQADSEHEKLEQYCSEQRALRFVPG
ncbi:protein of unknown function [Azospirillum lipoferum 4B]|uniref:Uncharacterized protein n=1 Tax=Azospirillum lipoferum (strain 4B) TaxID=862719 RepID=G7Z282_AZOL4|nr:protein of unknown function [Azospirillum lipoferum 4B]